MSPGVYLLAGSLICALVGLFVGKSRNRRIEGCLYGAILGPIGWIVVSWGPDKRRKCLYCHRALQADEIRCVSCGYDVQNPDYYSQVTPFVYCPSCGAQNQATPEQRTAGMRCSTCQVSFIPAADVANE